MFVTFELSGLLVINIEFSSVAQISTKLGHIVLQRTTTLGATLETDLTRKDIKYAKKHCYSFQGILQVQVLTLKDFSGVF